MCGCVCTQVSCHCTCVEMERVLKSVLSCCCVVVRHGHDCLHSLSYLEWPVLLSFQKCICAHLLCFVICFRCCHYLAVLVGGEWHFLGCFVFRVRETNVSSRACCVSMLPLQPLFMCKELRETNPSRLMIITIIYVFLCHVYILLCFSLWCLLSTF